MNKRCVCASFSREEDLLAAARFFSIKDGLKIVDAFTPYPVHGLEKTMNLPPSRITWVCFLFGAFGVFGSLLGQFWVSAIDWPINIGGRPWNSLPAFVPVTFEVMVLLGGLSSVAAFFLICRLFPGKQNNLPLEGATNSSFLLVLEAANSLYDIAEVKEILGRFHSTDFQEYDSESI